MIRTLFLRLFTWLVASHWLTGKEMSSTPSTTKALPFSLIFTVSCLLYFLPSARHILMLFTSLLFLGYWLLSLVKLQKDRKHTCSFHFGIPWCQHSAQHSTNKHTSFITFASFGFGTCSTDEKVCTVFKMDDHFVVLLKVTHKIRGNLPQGFVL